MGSGFVTLTEDASDLTNSIQEDNSLTSTEKISKQIPKTGDITAKEENEANNKLNDTEIGFKKIFRFGKLKFTLKKDKVEKIDVDDPVNNEQDRNATGLSDKGMMKDVPQIPEPEEPMSPIKRFFSQGILASFRKKRKEEEISKQNEELKCLDRVFEKDTTKEDTMCICLDVSNGTFDKDNDIQLYKKDEHKPAAEGDIMANFLEQNKEEASPFRRLFRKLSIRRQSETKPGDTNVFEHGANISENPQLSTELIKDEMMDMSHEESKKKSDSSVSWENLICIRSAKTRARKTSDSEDESQDKGEVPRKTTKSPLESPTEGEHLTSSNEQGGSPAEEDSGSTWKSFRKLVTPKRKSRMVESGLVEQTQSDTEITKDESSCSLRKLISGRKKIKPDGQQENISFDEGSGGTGTDIEDDEEPGVVPLSEYEIAEPEILNVITDGSIESEKEKEMQPIIEEDKPKQLQPLYNVKPLCVDAGRSGVPIPKEYMEELTEFLSKHQQLSDIPEEGIIEETAATPLSFVEWITQDDTLADDIADMTADAVTAPEHASEHDEDETTEMVSAVSQLSDSPKTSGNVTPISPRYDMRESDQIFQEVPEALAVSVSQFIVGSTSTTETKVLVTHKKEGGIVSQESRAAEVVLPLHLVEGMPEITQAVPAEFVSGNLEEESHAAGIATDNVYEAEIKEINTVLHEVLLLHEQNMVLAETARKSKQQIIMVKNIQEEVSPGEQMEDVEDESTELLNGIHEFTLVHSAVCGGTQLLEEQMITLNMNRPETEGMTGVLVSDVDCSETTAPTNNVIPVSDSIKMNLENDVQTKNDPSPNIVDRHTVQVKVNCTKLKTAKQNAEAVLSVGTTLDVADVFGNIEMIGEEEKSKQKIEPTSSQTNEEIVGEKIVCNLEAENLSEIIDKPTKVRDGKESELNTVARESTLPVATLYEENTIKKPEDMSEVMPSPGKEHTEIDTVLVEDCKRRQTAGDDIYMLTLNTTEAGEETKKVLAIADQSRVYEKMAEDGIQPPKTDSSKPVPHPDFSKLISDTQTTAVAPESREDSAKIDADKRPCMDDESDNLLVDEHEHNETTKPEVNPEITTKQGTGDTDKPCSEAEPQLDPNKPQTEMLPSKPEKSQASESYEENNQATEAMDKMTELISTVTFICIEETGVECNISDQPVATPQCSNGTSRVNSLKEVKRPCVDDQSVMSDTLLAQKQDDETAKPKVTTKSVIEHQETVETVKTSMKVEPRHNIERPQKEILSLKPEESQATESSHEAYEENNQVTGTAKITETLSSVIYEEDLEVELKISEKPVEVPVSTMEHVTEIVPKDKAQSAEGFFISENEGSEHVMEVIKANTYQVSAEVVSEHEAERRVGCGQNIVSPEVTEQEVVSEIDKANVAVPGKNVALTAALKLEDETTMITSEGQTVVTSDQVAESSTVTENKTKPEVLTQVIKELKKGTLEVTESKTDLLVVSEVQAEPPIVASLVTELKAEMPVDTSVEKSVKIKALALTSVINKVQSDLKSVSEPEVSTGTTLRETPIEFSGILTTVLPLVQPAALSPIVKEVSKKEDAKINRPVIVELTEPKLETLIVTEAISHTSAVPALEEQTIETSALETKTLVRTCVEKHVEAQGSAVASIKETPDVGTLVLTTTVSEAQLKTVIPVVQMLVELTATDIPAIQKPTDGQLIHEPEMSMVKEEIKETKLEIPDAVDDIVLKIPVAKETRVKAQGVTEQIMKGAEFDDTSLKKDMSSSVFTLIAEKLTVASCIKLPTVSVAPVVQTPTMVPAVVQRPTVLPVVEILAVNSAVKEGEMSFPGPEVKVGHCDAQVSVNTEVKQPVLSEIEVKVTERSEQVTQDVENTAKEDSKSPEEMSGRLKEVSVPIMKIIESQPRADDDVWEDAADDISDDQHCSTKANGGLQDTAMCHGDKWIW